MSHPLLNPAASWPSFFIYTAHSFPVGAVPIPEFKLAERYKRTVDLAFASPVLGAPGYRVIEISICWRRFFLVISERDRKRLGFCGSPETRVFGSEPNDFVTFYFLAFGIANTAEFDCLGLRVPKSFKHWAKVSNTGLASGAKASAISRNRLWSLDNA